MRCSRCQQENLSRAQFCMKCGAALIKTCGRCGAELSADAMSCVACGQVTGESSAVPRSGTPGPNPPEHIAERIRIPRDALEGERKQVTVLFADIKGSMELLADRDPEDARDLLDPVLEQMMEAVHRYGGTVNQVLGDGIMALFGAPFAQEDHAVRACYAALRMQETVKRYAVGVRTSHGTAVGIRIGLNSGEVVVRAIGSDLDMDYTAIGLTTHLAARLEQLADSGRVFISPATLSLATGFIEVAPVGPVAVKGLPAPVHVYELIGATALRSRLQAAAVRGLTGFVGRDAEMRQLHDTLDHALHGQGQIVATVGEAGIGKSRLIYEFVRSRHTRDWRVLSSGALSYAKSTSYLPIIDLLRTYFGIDDRDGPAEIREKVTSRLLSLDEELKPSLVTVLALLGLPIDDPPWQSLDPPQRRRRTQETITRILLRESQVQPLVLLFEDVQWIDGETQAVLNCLVETLPGARMLLLVTYRPGYQHGWAGRAYYSQIRLDPLPDKSVHELLDAILGTNPAAEPLKPLLIERTEGNPLFLEESIRMLVEARILTGERGSYAMGGHVASVEIPATVQAILAARIDRLAADEKQLLQSAAVIGHDVPLPLLRAVAGQPEDALRSGVARLQAAGFLHEADWFPDPAYTFNHNLTHEVAYASLLQERRRGLHSRIVEAIEALHPNRLSEQLPRLAQHAFRGRVWTKAVVYLCETGRQAFAHSAYRDAVRWFEQALEALAHLPQTDVTLRQAIDIRFELRNCLLPLGEHRRYFAYVQEAGALARTLKDQRRLGLVAAYTNAYLYLMGDQEGALRSGREALTVADALGDLDLRVPVIAWLGQAHYYRGEYREAARLFQQNVDALSGDRMAERFKLPYAPAVHSRTCLVWCLSELGEFARGIPIGNEGLDAARAMDHPLTLLTGYAGLGRLYVRKGDTEQATALLERGLELCRSWNVRLWFPRMASDLGSAYALDGRLTDAVSLLRQAVDQGNTMGLLGGHSHLVRSLAEALLLAGDVQTSRDLGRSALELARQHGERGHEAWALQLLANVSSRAGDPTEAMRHCEAAMKIAGDLDMRPLVGQLHLVLGCTHRSADRRAVARDHLLVAARLFRQMDMGHWASRAEEELTALR